MNVVFCCLNSKYIHSSLAPWCLFSACKQKCGDAISPFVVEGTINEPLENMQKRIMEKQPDVLSFSCYIWNIKATLALCERIKKEFANIKIVLGGPEASYNVKQLSEENECIDFVASGEGEVSIVQLLCCIRNAQTPDIAGISYRANDGFVTDNRAPGTDESISPFCEEYLQSLNGRIAYTESSRGCPFCCAFCLSGRLGKVRFIDLDTVKKNILLLGNSGTKTVKFVDRTFNCNKDRAAEILNFILENHGKNIPSDVCFHFEIAADLLDEKLFEIIEKLPVGSVQFEVGIQSFNENTLSAIHRKTDLQKVEHNVKRLLSFGNCHIHIDLIAGLPEEDFDSFADGFNRAYAIKADMLQLGFLKILHGSDMAENKELYPCNHCSEPPYEVIDTPFISQEELQKLHIAENELDRLYNSGRFRRTLGYVLSASGCTPFDLFFGFGMHIKNNRLANGCSLDAYTELAFSYYAGLDGVDKMHLRDCLVCDRMATNNSGRMPEALKIEDANLKKVKRALLQTEPPEKGTNRCVNILYSTNEAVFCDYKAQNKVSGEYELKKVNLKGLCL